eukprot:CAMPEP_0113665992 /NCGR_PEP_ID=MMETSP0038_2-20120614/2615_1 /TAXON_ID=2898 /ORGANISM="Cryptomonas paramecium" /LENGTH=39 /DNA_ID=CAMNT_0000581411 /DNA_START=294 /DNA_END=409 /DNA_ORIENTATION=+ /assembly_acc=CAM_ASM_000170
MDGIAAVMLSAPARDRGSDSVPRRVRPPRGHGAHPCAAA